MLKPGVRRAPHHPKGHKIFPSELTYLWFVCMFYGAAGTYCTVLYLRASEEGKAALSLWWPQDEGCITQWEDFGAFLAKEIMAVTDMPGAGSPLSTKYFS